MIKCSGQSWQQLLGKPKYCNCANCGREIQTFWRSDSIRLTDVPARVDDRPLCHRCEKEYRDGRAAPSYEHTLKVCGLV